MGSDLGKPSSRTSIERLRTIGQSRRRFLVGAGAVAMGTVAGCLGGDDEEAAGPDPPWTTDDLAEQIDDDATVTIYAGTGGGESWYDIIDVINDEFGMNIEANVVASDAATISQRFVQERQADEDKADIVGPAANLRDEIRKKGQDEGVDQAREWFEDDLDENFWFGDELVDAQNQSFQVPSRNAGAGLCIPVSEEIFDDRGLDYPTSYNDLFEDQYEGLDVGFSGYVAAQQVGWIIRHHAPKTDMDNMEWIETLMDHINVVGVDSYTAGTREVGKGNIPMMFFNWPQSAEPFVTNEEMAVRGVFPDPVPSKAIEDPISINKNAPNPWVARFFVSAILEKPVQERMFTDVRKAVPGRIDLEFDYDSLDVPDFTRKRMTVNFDLIGFWEGTEIAETGQKAVDKGIFQP